MPIRRLIFVPLLACSLHIAAQQPTDVQQIDSLINDLSNHTRKPSELIDPQATHTKHLNDLSAPYTLALTQEADPSFNGNGTATLPVRVHFKTDSGELETSSTAHFVLRNHTWYFADLSFLDFPNFLIAVLIIGCLIGVTYAAFALTIYFRLSNKGMLTPSNRLRSSIPFYWPSLLRATR
jgi:hypothetical protein